MDPNSWTPARGWTIALGKAGLRSAIVFIILAAGLYAAWPIDKYLPAHWAVLAVLFLISAGAGYPIGYCVARKLPEDSGLAGVSVLVPVLVLLIAAAIAAYHVAATLRGGGGIVIWVVSLSVTLWSIAAAFRTLIME